MQLVAVVMHGNSLVRIYPLFLIYIVLLLLTGCSNRDNASLSSNSTETKTNQISDATAFKTVASEELLKPSIKISYPEGVYFTPTYLTDDSLVIGEAYDMNNQSENYLAVLNIKDRSFKKIKYVDKTSEIVTIIVNYADKDYIIFEEFDQVNRKSIYFIFNLREGDYKIIHSVLNVNPIHYTQIARQGNKLYMNMFYKSDIYRTYSFDLLSGNMKVIEKENSSHPIYFNGNVYYILIDNSHQITKIIKYNEHDELKKEVKELSRKDNFYNGLFSNDKNVIISEYKLEINYLSLGNIETEKQFFSSNWIETLDYKGNYITFLGDRIDKDRVRPQYYLFDLKKMINYNYDDGIILLSKTGIFWVDFLKDEKEIEKGQIFTNDNSVMRYLAFDE